MNSEKWFGSGKMTSSEEYLKNGIVSYGVHVVLVNVFFLLCKGLTSENVEIIDKILAIISSSAMILQLWDDLGNSEVPHRYPQFNFDFLFTLIAVSSTTSKFLRC
jgi:(3S)-linalool synthase